MGFPPPAADYVEARIFLNQQLVSQPATTYFMRVSRLRSREGIIQGMLLVVDVPFSPCDDSLLIYAIDGEFRIKRYRTHPQPHLVSLEDERRGTLPVGNGGYSSAPTIFGMLTYIINGTRNAELDGCLVM